MSVQEVRARDDRARAFWHSGGGYREQDSDLALLAYLVGLVALFAGLAFLLWWLMRPTYVPNPGLAAYKPPIAASGLAAYALSPATDSAAQLAADEDNDRASFAKAENPATANPAEPKPVRPPAVRKRPRPAVTAERPTYDNHWGFDQRQSWDSRPSGDPRRGYDDRRSTGFGFFGDTRSYPQQRAGAPRDRWF